MKVTLTFPDDVYLKFGAASQGQFSVLDYVRSHYLTDEAKKECISIKAKLDSDKKEKKSKKSSEKRNKK